MRKAEQRAILVGCGSVSTFNGIWQRSREGEVYRHGRACFRRVWRVISPVKLPLQNALARCYECMSRSRSGILATQRGHSYSIESYRMYAELGLPKHSGKYDTRMGMHVLPRTGTEKELCVADGTDVRNNRVSQQGPSGQLASGKDYGPGDDSSSPI
jgi:hypothetical protein